MKNKTSKILAMIGVGVFALVAQSVIASPIYVNGGISFGSLNLNPFTTDSGSPTSLATANDVSFSTTGIYAGAASGTYALATGYGYVQALASLPSPITFDAFSWAGYGASPAAFVAPLWSFTDGGITYSFAATTMTASFSDGQWTFGGAGIAYVTGDAPTGGNWNEQIGETVTGPEKSFTFDASSTAAGSPPVPDGGLTVALLGGAFVGLGMLRRKLCN